jgi:hypothetical protein
MSYFALQGIENLKKMLELLKNIKAHSPIVRYLITLFDKRSNFAQDFLEKARLELGSALAKTIIRSNVALREAASMGVSIFDHKPKANGALDYAALAKEIKTKHVPSRISVKEFSVEAPDAKKVYLVGDFNGWKVDERYLLSKVENNGKWTGRVKLNKGRYRYKFLVDERWVEDKENPLAQDSPFGGKDSILVLE